ncbi:MAG TPA: hypothetical protein PLV33_06305 [Opitutaceae bacterium]|nr:hypothetical protein [Opitutaceae bacterium]HOR78251.1 hypothetical protein [Anaerolineaceae bacterium]
MSTFETAKRLAEDYKSKDLNEADTRHQILDVLFHDVLGWPRKAVKCEQHVHEGYCDYVITNPLDKAVLIIEAKKEGKFFELPVQAKTIDEIRMIKLERLCTDPQIKAAVLQVVSYCPEFGCVHAGITNGHVYIFFRTFIHNQNFMNADAFIIPSLELFASNHTVLYNKLSYQAITRNNSLGILFSDPRANTRELHFPKLNILHYDTPFKVNNYAKFLEPIAKRYFGEISMEDQKLMSSCYVYARSLKDAEQGIKQRLSDCLTPYFEAEGGQDIEELRGGGKLNHKIVSALKRHGHSEIVILYGGKGAGKSTFLRRLFYHETPQDIQLHGFPIIIDCLKGPQNESEINNFFLDTIITALDTDRILEGTLPELLNLFNDKYELAKKQELYGIHEHTIDFIKLRANLVAAWKKDKLYVARRLKNYQVANGKHAIIAFDNTDQLNPALQDYCFLISQNICTELAAIGIISMREERYCRARTSGVLDAYQNSGFHLSAPDLLGVFQKRIHLVIEDLGAASQGKSHECLPPDAPYEQLKSFFICCTKQFGANQNSLKEFLVQCSRDNTRFALEFFRQFLCSGYTHVEEMIAEQNWTIISHQVIKPMMVPNRFNYDEEKSIIPNVYKCRKSHAGSHFTMLRILRAIAHSSEQGQMYLSIPSLIDQFEFKFQMREDCEECLDVLLYNGLIEASNRLDHYRVQKSTEANEYIYADQVRITAFGHYMLNSLCKAFTYIELVSLDCGYFSEQVFQSMVQAAVAERNVPTAEDRLKRLTSRLSRAQNFIDYLDAEEAREKVSFSLGESEVIVPTIRAAFNNERPLILKGGQRNILQKTETIGPQQGTGQR